MLPEMEPAHVRVAASGERQGTEAPCSSWGWHHPRAQGGHPGVVQDPRTPKAMHTKSFVYSTASTVSSFTMTPVQYQPYPK